MMLQAVLGQFDCLSALPMNNDVVLTKTAAFILNNQKCSVFAERF